MLPALPPEPGDETFADDSYPCTGAAPDLIVTAQFPGGATLEALHQLAQVLHRDRSQPFELKYHGWDLARRRSETRDLAERAGLELRQALISIVDAERKSPWREEAERGWLGELLAAHPPGSPFGVRLREMWAASIDEELVLDSIAQRIEWSVRAAFGMSEPRLDRHNLRLDVARSNAALADVFDSERRAAAFAELRSTVRFFEPQRFTLHMLRASLPTGRVFDDGNRPSVDRLRQRRDHYAELVDADARTYCLPQIRLGRTAEVRSDTSFLVQAADVASGLARRLYVRPDGLKVVLDTFARVVLNGDLLK